MNVIISYKVVTYGKSLCYNSTNSLLNMNSRIDKRILYTTQIITVFSVVKKLLYFYFGYIFIILGGNNICS